MSLPRFEDFRDHMLSDGYDEVLERPWQPGAVVERHTHPFEARALVVAGEMWLTPEGQPTQHLLPGDHFHLLAHQPHTERYGPLGATYWVARKAA